MADGFSTEVIVKRRQRDGWSLYTSEDLPGLFVACNDDRKAYNDIPASIQALMKLDHGIDCTVTHRVEYSAFVRQVHLRQRATDAVSKRTNDMMDGGNDRLHFAVHPVEVDRRAS